MQLLIVARRRVLISWQLRRSCSGTVRERGGGEVERGNWVCQGSWPCVRWSGINEQAILIIIIYKLNNEAESVQSEEQKTERESSRKKCANCKSMTEKEREREGVREGDRKECIVLTYFHIFVHLCVCVFVCLPVGATLINIRICFTAELDNCHSPHSLPLPL